MNPDPTRVSDTRAWLAKAAQDLRGAEHDFSATPPLLDDAVFHCQQAAEKSLKGFLTWHDTPFRKTHSLEEVGEQCLGIDPSLKPIIDRAIPMTEYAWKFRYPGELDEPTLEEAQQALEIARSVWDAVVGRLPHDVRPNR